MGLFVLYQFDYDVIVKIIETNEFSMNLIVGNLTVGIGMSERGQRLQPLAGQLAMNAVRLPKVGHGIGQTRGQQENDQATKRQAVRITSHLRVLQ